MIHDELRPIVTEFIAEMLNDPHCESILLDTGDDARADSSLPALYLDVTGKRCGYTLSIVGDEYSARIQNFDTGKTVATVKGEKGVWGLRKLLTEFKTRLWEDN